MYHPVNSISSWTDRPTCFKETKCIDAIHPTPYDFASAVSKENDENRWHCIMLYKNQENDRLGTWQSIGRTEFIHEQI
jgi:hypothetical protein